MMRAAMLAGLGQEKYELFFETLLTSFYGEADVAFVAESGLTCVRIPVDYRDPFAGTRLSEDDVAVADLLERTGAWARAEGAEPYSLAEGLQDHLTSVAIGESADDRPRRDNGAGGLGPVRAAVLHQPGEPLRIEDLELDDPRPGEVRVRVAAAGVCHSDYHYMTGDLPCRLPIVVGHEGSGTVEAVGEGVESVAPGDLVTMLWRPRCGRCRYCVIGQPVMCELGKVQASTTGCPTMAPPACGWTGARCTT